MELTFQQLGFGIGGAVFGLWVSTTETDGPRLLEAA
jgi:hypothetical protein